MKKLKLKALELGAKEVLSRAQLKNVLGGSGSGSGGSAQCFGNSCTVTIQGDNGSFITRSGTCRDVASILDPSCYCDTGLGNIPVTSNGGKSKCTR